MLLTMLLINFQANYSPSYLLCPEVYNWHSIEKCVPKLNVSKYSRFEDDKDMIDQDAKDINDNEIMILHQRKVLTYQSYKTRSNSHDDEVKEFASLVGRKNTKNILLFR